MTTWTVILLVVAAAGVVLAVSGSWLQERRATAAQLASIRRKLDLVLDHLGIADTAPERSEVRALVEDGQVIEAVRVYRRLTGASLLEAKHAVDNIAAGR